MLRLYRRHLKACKFASKGRTYTKCGCPIWCDGTLRGKTIRKSLDSFNWEHAHRIILEMTAGETQVNATVPDAVKDFLAELRGRNLKEATVDKYEQILVPMEQFCLARGITTIRGLADLATLRGFVESIPDSPMTKAKKIERIRSFFRHCVDMRWCDVNPAIKVRKPVVTNAPVLPFSAEQYQAILGAIDKYPTKNSFHYDNRARLRAFLYTLRYCAFRISDAVSLRRATVKDGRVLIRTLKTGATVHLPLPKFVLDALAEVKGEGEYFFWTGNGKLKSAIADWQRSVRRLFELANIQGHPHMFRHTMAIELLEKGVTVEHVAQILGNTPTIVVKHYSPWIPSRQKALDEAVMSVWGD